MGGTLPMVSAAAVEYLLNVHRALLVCEKVIPECHPSPILLVLVILKNILDLKLAQRTSILLFKYLS